MAQIQLQAAHYLVKDIIWYSSCEEIVTICEILGLAGEVINPVHLCCPCDLEMNKRLLAFLTQKWKLGFITIYNEYSLKDVVRATVKMQMGGLNLGCALSEGTKCLFLNSFVKVTGTRCKKNPTYQFVLKTDNLQEGWMRIRDVNNILGTMKGPIGYSFHIICAMAAPNGVVAALGFLRYLMRLVW